MRLKTGRVGDFFNTVLEPCSLCGQYHPIGWQDRRAYSPKGGR